MKLTVLQLSMGLFKMIEDIENRPFNRRCLLAFYYQLNGIYKATGEKTMLDLKLIDNNSKLKVSQDSKIITIYDSIELLYFYDWLVNNQEQLKVVNKMLNMCDHFCKYPALTKDQGVLERFCTVCPYDTIVATCNSKKMRASDKIELIKEVIEFENKE